MVNVSVKGALVAPNEKVLASTGFGSSTAGAAAAVLFMPNENVTLAGSGRTTFDLSDDPNENCDELDSEFGFGCSQQAHFVAESSLRVMHAEHSHFDVFCFDTRLLNPSSAGIVGALENELKLDFGAVAATAPGFADSQHTHLL